MSDAANKKIKIYKVPLRTISPLKIGTGEEDILTVRGKALISGTSIAGVFSEFLKDDDELNKLFLCGYRSDEEDLNDTEMKKDFMETYYEEVNLKDMISPVTFNDSISKEKTGSLLCRRPHVRIDRRYGIAEDESLREEKHLKDGIDFDFIIEVDGTKIKEGYYKKFCAKVEEFISMLACGRISLGSKSTFGFGRFKSLKGKYISKEFDLRNSIDDYLDFDINDDKWGEEKTIEESKPENWVEIEFKGYCKDGFIIKGMEERINGNKTSVSYREDGSGYIIASSTVKGMISSYSEKILNTLGKRTNIITDIFGGSKPAGAGKEKKIKGKVYFEDIKLVKDDITEERYNCIKIDRFTGGVIDGALFSEQVVCTKEEKPISIRIRLNKGNFIDKRDENLEFLNQTKALIMLSFRDLGLSRFSIGSGQNIGHGFLQGKEIVIRDNEEEIYMHFVGGRIESEHEKRIEQIIASLQDLKGVEDDEQHE